MKYSRITLLIGHMPEEDAEHWDCGCDQTFGLSRFHQPEKHQYLIAHDRGFVDGRIVNKLKTAVFTEEGGI